VIVATRVAIIVTRRSILIRGGARHRNSAVATIKNRRGAAAERVSDTRLAARVFAHRIGSPPSSPPPPPRRLPLPAILLHGTGLIPRHGGAVAGQSAVKRCEQWHFGVRGRAGDANRSRRTHTRVNKRTYSFAAFSFVRVDRIDQERRLWNRDWSNSASILDHARLNRNDDARRGCANPCPLNNPNERRACIDPAIPRVVPRCATRIRKPNVSGVSAAARARAHY